MRSFLVFGAFKNNHRGWVKTIAAESSDAAINEAWFSVDDPDFIVSGYVEIMPGMVFSYGVSEINE